MPAFTEARSMMGSSAAECVDRSLLNPGRRERRARRIIKVARVRPGDALRGGTCTRCGFEGSHARPDDCIDALRGEMARLEFLAEAKAEPPRGPERASPETIAAFMKSLDRGARTAQL